MSFKISARPMATELKDNRTGITAYVCINASQDEVYFVYTCTQQSFQNNLKEFNNSETSTSFYGTFT